jgi:pyridoxamine 5'-phosphate oxidase
MSSANLRSEYSFNGLDVANSDPNPFTQFRAWFDQALAAQVPEPNAMTLATANALGRPSARMVLLKGFDEAGFVFYTNYESRKSHDLAENPWAALVIYWNQLGRQVRIEGSVAQLPADESDAYFQSRPWGSRIGAWASHQSQVIDSRALLDARVQALMTEYQDREIPRPPYWGGYQLHPLLIEFWQGRPNRLHDRLRYRRLVTGDWLIERLSP